MEKIQSISSNPDIIQLISQHLVHKHLWRCDLKSLGLLASVSPVAHRSLKETLSKLKTKEFHRRQLVSKCHQLLADLPLPLLNTHWTDGIFAKARVYVSCNGHIIVRETSALVTHNRSHSLKVSIRPIMNHYKRPGLIVLYSSTHPQISHPIGPQFRRFQSFAFSSIRELLYVLRLYTMLGSSLWYMHFKEAALALTHEMWWLTLH